ncbi:unnamed protein product [Cylicocyclus nassatus]|uniref:Globin domain-containing protein n=1 Tax=Cylicocyclus nassatus TaxID=53992 RepID=A0AA36H882_CYLNA|nr:unnamed protein product [Cylicocyclus nassatus]
MPQILAKCSYGSINPSELGVISGIHYHPIEDIVQLKIHAANKMFCAHNFFRPFPMVNKDLLKKHASQYKLTKDTAGEYHKQLFKLHPEMAKYYDAEDIDPDSIPKAMKFVMLGQQELQFFFRLPDVVDQDRQWRSALSSFKETFSDNNVPLNEFNKVTDAFLAAMEKNAGGVTPEQKKEWEELLAKAYADMKTWGWY